MNHLSFLKLVLRSIGWKHSISDLFFQLKPKHLSPFSFLPLRKNNNLSALHCDVEGCNFHVAFGFLFAFSDVILRFCLNISFGEVV